MSRDITSDRELARILDEQIEAMQAVLGSLDAERRALSHRDGDALLDAVNAKTASLAAADSLEQKRQALFEELGLHRRTAGRGREFHADTGLAQRWQRVLVLTRECQAINEANGQLIRGQHRRIDTTLRILRGEPSASAEYGPAGERRRGSASRSIGSC